MISNPVSGGIDKSEFIEATALFAAKENLNFILYETSGTNDILKIQELYAAFKPERIIVAGGDGTIKMASEAMEEEDVILGILPAGSANGLAVELNLIKTLDENLIIAFHNNFMEVDMVVINGKRSLHLSDIGLNAELIKNYENSAIHGRWGYALQVFNTLIGKEELFEAIISANNAVIECEAHMIVIANAQKYGTGVVINPHGVLDDGKFELIILKNLDLMVFGKIVSGNMPLDPKEVLIISTDKATIKTNIPVSFQIDGEFCGAETELNIEILSKKTKIAIP
ncbi:diacylglycerol kinase family protein [Flavobacterium sp. K5-23]|uniref:diacylglycerol/lipid kinase family protein n=1 Tax=Flavobacterium sp. K5-23 TaxID=2746225 RepID=UPI00200FA29B|nr:diacylglycerol kinase family protein [Flavobacterium sp. K5-23]